ncbi:MULTISPECIES: SDR family oxidoreductase [unclassified Arthrobacter]|uniref:SDR family oxidoreductase n=1 Tax=unclassified Arthrobacter TaxID=235627 RepID=UPI00131A09B0|nr:SDR family oxidoreductase [Arthrobacter sp. PGP41]
MGHRRRRDDPHPRRQHPRHAARSCDAEIKKNGTGSIVKISSAAGLVGGVSGGPAAYSAIKEALRAITKKIALDVAKADVRLNTVRSRLTRTPIIEAMSKETADAVLSKIPIFGADPIDITYRVLFLAEPRVRDRNRRRHHHRRRPRRPVKETP